MDTAINFYTGIIQAGAATDIIYRRAAALFEQHSSSALGVVLLRSPGLPDELADRVCAAGGIDELVGWLSRPGRTTEQIIAKVKSEKRVTVLQALLDRDDMPPEIFI